MTNLAFTALIKSKGYNKQRLADVCGLSKTQMSNRINGANDWRWPEVGKACAALGITLDEFATYYPVADVRKSSAAMRLSWDRYTELGIPLPGWFVIGVRQLGSTAPSEYTRALSALEE